MLVVDAVTSPLVSVVNDEVAAVSEVVVKLLIKGVEKLVLVNKPWVDEEVIVKGSPGLGEIPPATAGSAERNPAAITHMSPIIACIRLSASQKRCITNSTCIPATSNTAGPKPNHELHYQS